MRASQLFFKTLRHLPEEVDAASHRLLLRTGMVQQVASGIFSFLPLGWRSIQKIRAIINQEMVRIGGQEVCMPVVQPIDLWEESGRIETFIPPLARFKDRRDHYMVLAPTHEETMTLMARSVISSYRDMPAILYHIQTKFRDEVRSRGGLLRVREFEMKDAYSFDRDQAGLDHSFDQMALAYRRIFDRCATPTIAVEADSGGIGGKDSNEFVMLSDTGEDVVLVCDNPDCGYAANVEKAVFKPIAAEPEEPLPMERFDTPGVNTIQALAEFTNMPRSKTAKAVFYSIDGEVVLVVIRGDYEVNNTKLRNLLKATDVALATPEQVVAAKLVAGYTSPVGLDGKIKVVADSSIEASPNLLGGANQKDLHLRNVNYGRDYKADFVADIASAADGSACARCDGGRLREQRGIEVGHIFKLGSIYSESMGFNFQNAEGQQVPPLMGCYGIGLGRLLAAIIEGNHDERGIKFPKSVAPFTVAVVALNVKDEAVAKGAEQVYAELCASGQEVLLDDRDLPPGAKLTDADLIGYPVRVVVSKRTLAEGQVEIKLRTADEAEHIPAGEAAARVGELLDGLN